MTIFTLGNLLDLENANEHTCFREDINERDHSGLWPLCDKVLLGMNLHQRSGRTDSGEAIRV